MARPREQRLIRVPLLDHSTTLGSLERRHDSHVSSFHLFENPLGMGPSLWSIDLAIALLGYGKTMLPRENFEGPHMRHNRRTLPQDAQTDRPLRLWFLWFIRLVRFNQINETNQTNQSNQPVLTLHGCRERRMG